MSTVDNWPDLPLIDAEAEAKSEAEFESVDDGPRTVLITGACGNIGRKLRAAWADSYDLILLDSAAGPEEPEVVAADLSTFDDEWAECFHGADTVVHLAANPSERATWEELIGPNLDALANVFHAAALAGVDRVVYASSNHAMSGYRHVGDGPITVDTPPLPGNPYGAAKLMGERLGKSLADAFEMTFIALRLGWVQPGANRPETLPDDWNRALWLSNADAVLLFECAVEADLGERRFVVVNGMSRNRGTRWDLAHSAEAIGFEPQDDVHAEKPS